MCTVIACNVGHVCDWVYCFAFNHYDSRHCAIDIADSLSDSGYDHRKIKKAKRTDEEKKKRKKEKKKKKEKEKEDKVVFSQ